ncbi:hypothetical protein K469DRAFT_714208 [Zopfia rhizophila CBS 207.26]|uniref:Uncharacterized protein n=1 Tax=Zopfia rhizophila CBS 207.26 TaxID=1314779 RepID=A0A6A6DN69_9PEZI|nr:hypothetical protein K469DRAFT_714208 [Zopfia rhizophila CBS 207.26]
MSVADTYSHIVNDLANYGLQLRTFAYKKGVDANLDTDLGKFKHNIDADAQLFLHSDLSSLLEHDLETRDPNIGESVAIVVVDSSDLVVGLYDFDLIANFTDEEREAAATEFFEPQADQAVLGLKWIHANYRSNLVLGTERHPYTVNMAMTEVGWLIMEYDGRMVEAFTVCATTAGEKSARNAGMEVDSYVGKLTFSQRKSWKDKTEEFAEYLASRG